MRSAAIALPIAVLSCAVLAQEAEYEIPGLFGECHPFFATTKDFLTVYERPDLRSPTRQIPYNEGWEIPYTTGHTRVIQIGKVTAKADVPLTYCSIKPLSVSAVPAGQTVEFLFYEGEGYGRIRIDGGQCTVPVHDDLGFFSLNQALNVQPWIHAKYADGSSPGWVPLTNIEIRGAGVRC